MITCLSIAGYRSLRDIRLRLGRLNVITGANGSGKSNLYRALLLLANVAQGSVVQALAMEGGIPSTLWAGPEAFSRAMKRGEQAVTGLRRKGPVAVKLGFAGEDYGYAIELGLPQPARTSMFTLDPEIKLETMWTGEFLGRANGFAARSGSAVRIRGEDGQWQQAYSHLAPVDSMMTHCADPKGAVELLEMRERMRNWRFYDQLRTDRDAPARRPHVGTYTPVLASDGVDLAAALQTILEIGDGEALAGAIDDAFQGCTIAIASKDGYFDVEIRQPGLLRPLRLAEISDGTLRYLLLCAALLSPRLPQLMVLNEPETSLHPDLLPPLGRLIAQASRDAQVIVVSHARALVEELERVPARRIELQKSLGETVVDDEDPPRWEWPVR